MRQARSPTIVRHVTSTGLGMPTHSSFGCAAALFHERVIGPEAYRRPTLHDYFATRNFLVLANNPTHVEVGPSKWSGIVNRRHRRLGHRNVEPVPTEGSRNTFLRENDSDEVAPEVGLEPTTR